MGEAVGEDSPSSAFLDDFLVGDSPGEADSSAVALVLFFIDDFFDDFLVVEVALVEAPVEEVVVAVSCFWAQETTNAIAITATIKDRNDFFIGVWLRLCGDQNCKLLLLVQAHSFTSSCAAVAW